MTQAVILADGSFPTHEVPLGHLKKAGVIVCCDGSTRSLVKHGMTPDAIVGDMDTLDKELASAFADRIFTDENQETNDLTKAVEWCRKSGYDDITILGATGKREDHSIGNISLLAEYSKFVRIRMITDNGIFLPIHDSCRIETFPGQQISVFSINPETEITSNGLRFPLVRRKLKNWWEATLNEATGNSVELDFRGGPLLIFLAFLQSRR
ncbi:MAG: thiamine diphosphokinase [Bacteroidales bacterium]|jgi:thiamine pyrophosphokinase|nr:thiamine diphosphokinase [Bacteroidales bacterium]